MDERSGYISVGVFVLTAAVVTVLFVLWIGDGRDRESDNHYTIEFARDVSGLSVGSPVRYMGVDVGEVVDLELITNRDTQVAVHIAVAGSTPIHSGTYASLTYQGITGVAYINLAADYGEFPGLQARAPGHPPIIPARDVGLPALLAQSGNITAKIDGVLDQAGDLLGERNQASLSRSLANLAVLSDALAGERQTIAALPGRFSAGLAELRSTAVRVQALLDQTEPDLVSAIAQLNEATADAARLTNRLERILDGNEEPLDHFVGNGLAELPALVAESRRSLRELDKLLMALREDPSRLLHRPRQNAVQAER
jgi:phospholipid/cholesterol/gamma-HCH transport system substrate-binding protein